MIYLDNSSTTRQYDEVSDLMCRIAKEDFGNPSSLHNLGFRASNILSESREEMADYFYGKGTVVFTSGGTESDNMALISAATKLKRQGSKIITTKIEHPAILETCKRLEHEGFEIEYVETDVDGYVEPQAVTALLDNNTIIVSVMTVNNEVGTIEPVMEIYRIVEDYNRKNARHILFHTDAVQAFGKIAFDEAPFDLISVSGHKIHGPKGVGLLYMKEGVTIPPFITGGGQEGGQRSSTENLPGIAGFSLATKMSYTNLMNKMKKMADVNNYLRDGLMTELKDVDVNGPFDIGFTLVDNGRRCPSVLNMSFYGTRGEVLLHTLEQDEIYVSTGSACSSHKTGDSHVLSAMSMNHKEIESAIRFSFSEFNTIEEMDIVIERMKNAVNRFRKLGTYQ